MTTGGELSGQIAASETGVPATLRPWSSFHATKRASWDSETSFANPDTGMKQSIAGGLPRSPPMPPAVASSRILPSRRVVLELQRDQLPVGGGVGAVHGESAAGCRRQPALEVALVRR